MPLPIPSRLEDLRHMTSGRLASGSRSAFAATGPFPGERHHSAPLRTLAGSG